MKFLQPEHYEVRLTEEEMKRMITWMDTNALFFGTFNPADQARQRRGERIAGPGLEQDGVSRGRHPTELDIHRGGDDRCQPILCIRITGDLGLVGLSGSRGSVNNSRLI